jgi:energy-coupling factor transporter ATP-binding protein EcfA2
MYVARLEISGVRGFHGERSVNLDLTRPDGSFAGWTVLAGRNGSGKSTVLQSLALLFAGPRSTGFIPSLADWMSRGVSNAEMAATLIISETDWVESTLFKEIERKVWMRFKRPPGIQDNDSAEPDFSGAGLDSASGQYGGISSVKSAPHGWFYAGYGPFRHLGGSGVGGSRRTSSSKLSRQVSSLFDESISLADAVDWLIDQHLYRLEGRTGAERLLDLVIALLGDGLLPDQFQISGVDSDGLWISHGNSSFPLREMSDGYRAVTALVVDIVRQMHASYNKIELRYNGDVPTLPYPGVVLIDEVDAHLHVSWQKIIGTWLKEHFPEIQFIVTTHSPYVCQSADPGGLILLPGPGEHHPPSAVSSDLYERIIYGSGDDAVLSELFGIGTPYSAEAERLRRRLGDLEIKVLNGSALDSEKDEYQELSRTLTSSLGARIDEISARLGREN